jgi:hypothetical protein
MALKKKLTKDEYEKLAPALKTEYVEDDGGYKLDIDGEEDTGALKRAKDREAQKARDEKKRADELQEKLDAVTDGDARKKGDIETLEKSWQKKEGETKKQYDARIAKLEGHIKTSLVDTLASQIAHKISNAPSLILPHIKQRLIADLEGDTPTTKVLDRDGKASAFTIEDLTKEFVANKEFSSIMIGSKATGGGAPKNGLGKLGSATTPTDDKPINLASMHPRDLAATIKANKERQGD